MNDIENIAIDDWQTLEDKNFSDIQCIRVTLKKEKVIYRVIGPKGTITLLDKKTKAPKLIELVIANPRTYLNEALNPLIPYGYWTCECEDDWVHTPFTSHCPLCNCGIENTTNKAKYIEETKLL